MKKDLLFLLIATCVVSSLHAVPASPYPFVVMQPDGTQLTLYTMGDEYYHWIETADNHIVMQNNNGYYEYATIENNEISLSGVRVSDVASFTSLKTNKNISDREEIINIMLNKRAAIMTQVDSMARETRQERTEIANTTAASSSTISLTKGNQKVLCILIGFPDKPFTKTKADFEAMWNATGYNVLGSQGSVKEYYLENSYGHLNVTATVVGPYTAKYNSSYYDTGTSSSTIGSSKVKELIEEAITASKNDIQFKDFDINDDNYVDAIHVVFAGYGKECSLATGVIWSHRSQLSSPVRQNVVYKAQEYFCTPELANGTGTDIAPMGTVCHEYGHTLGAPDYYDVNYTDFTGTGAWDIMGSGNWNGDGRCPAHHNPYTKAYIYDWAIPAIIPSSAQNSVYDMSPSHNSASFYRINTSTANEFFLLENKAKIANTFNAGCPSIGGLLIYHIHSDLQNAIANNSVNTSHPQKCYIVCANATSGPNSAPSSYGSTNNAAYPTSSNDKTFFTSTSTPSAKSWAGVATGVNICFIQRNGYNIKFVVNPQIQGGNTLSSQSIYSVANVPAGAKIKWTYTFTPSSSSQNPLGKPILFVNGDSIPSVIVKRGTYPVIRDTLGPIPPRDSIILMASEYSTTLESASTNGTVEYVYYSGTAVLKATITSGGYSYAITKTIILSSTSASAVIVTENEDTEDVSAESHIENSALSEETVESFRLVYTNPVSTSTANIQVEKWDKGNYIPYQGNYTLSIWNDKLGLVQQISDKQSDITMDCSRLPNGVYQIILQIDGNVVASSKMLIL